MIIRNEALQSPIAQDSMLPDPGIRIREAGHLQPRAVKPRLTAAAEKELVLKMIDDRCPVSREHLIAANLPLVSAIAWMYSGRGIPMTQLIEQGRIGLIEALDSFDPTHGGRFSTYASWGIKQVLKQVVNQGQRRAVLENGVKA